MTRNVHRDRRPPDPASRAGRATRFSGQRVRERNRRR